MLTGGMAAIAAWYGTRRVLFLALGFFALGLGLWDKAIFAWSIVGLTVATIAALPVVLIRSVSVRTVAVATLAFAAGAFPLIRYNVRQNWVTFRTNAQPSSEPFMDKFGSLLVTFDGSGLFGSIMREPDDGPVREPATAAERFVVATSRASGFRRTNFGWPLFLASVLLLPFVWRTPARRAALFALVFIAVTWGQMVPIRFAGSVHHTILLWPMPQFAVAAVLGAISMRVRFGGPAVAAVTTAACTASLLVIATYYTNLIRNGGTSAWTEALYPAIDAIRAMRPERVCVIDFGFHDNLRALLEAEPAVCVADDPVTPEGKRYARLQISQPGTLFVAHTPTHEFDAGSAERHARFVRDEGYAKADQQVFVDRNGRAAIEIYRTIKLP
jgi:hypothetical protein